MLRLLPRLALKSVAAAAGAATAAAAAYGHSADVGAPPRRKPVAADDPTHLEIERLYRGLHDGHEIPPAEEQAIEDSGGHEAYGELTLRGVREVQELLGPVRDGDVFYDLGSGTGRMCVQAALEWPGLAKACGIELA